MFRSHWRWFLLSILAGLGAVAPASSATIRVATYNIKCLSTDVTNQDDRLDKLREVFVATQLIEEDCSSAGGESIGLSTTSAT